MGSSTPLAIRREPIEYGIPIASWLGQVDSPNVIANIVKQLVDAGSAEGSRSYVPIPILAQILDVPLQHAQTLVDIIEAVAEDHQGVCRRNEGTPANHVDGNCESQYPDSVDAYAVGLFLFAQLYQRQAARPDTMDVWPSTSEGPSTSGGAGANNSNSNNSGPVPMDTAPSFSRVNFASSSSRSTLSPHSPVHYQQQKSNHLVLKELQAHLMQHQQTLRGYCEYVERHALALLQLVKNHQEAGAEVDGMQAAGLTAAEFDRLSLLFRPSSSAPAMMEVDSEPMEVTPSNPFSESGRLSTHVPLFENGVAPFPALVEWLSSNVVDEQPLAEVMASSPMKGGRGNALPPAGVVQSGSMEVQGVCKSTVVRGEDDFDNGVLRVTDCHDSIVYALAPLQYASVTCCSDCTVVLGAVGKLAPYNTQYERLALHLSQAGVTAEPNLWDKPVTLAREHGRATPDSGTDIPGGTALPKARDPVQLLPPDRLVPFMVPFQGGRGPMCGGAASSNVTRIAADLGSFMGLSEGMSAHAPMAPSPFRLPPAYEDAKDKKVAAVAELRNAVKSAVLDEPKKKELQSVIQSYFKEWLVQSGNMRQVYDLARMEREEGPGSR